MRILEVLLRGFLAQSLAACGVNPKVPPPRPKEPMNLESAREYVLALVNHDRAEAGLPPVERDRDAERAGQEHAADMGRFGYTAHWGSDGSVPEERYTMAGGQHFVQENAACFGDGVERKLDPNPKFTAANLEKIEAAFMAEVPPNDGHRRNILKDTHTALGVGLVQPLGLPQPCMTQEFVDERGSYDALPTKARVGAKLRVAGELTSPVEFGGVGVSRIAPRKPMPASALNRTSSYPVPSPYVLYFPAGFRTPKPVVMRGKHFEIDVSLSQGRGRYGVSVWGRYPGAGNQLVMVSLRVIDVE